MVRAFFVPLTIWIIRLKFSIKILEIKHQFKLMSINSIFDWCHLLIF